MHLQLVGLTGPGGLAAMAKRKNYRPSCDRQRVAIAMASGRWQCQESGKNRGLFRRLAFEIGTDEATIRAALNRNELL
jgi:hypothetical protein